MDMSRRQALKKIYGALLTCGASSFITFGDLIAAERQQDKRVNVIWLHAASCTGCSCSLLDIDTVPVVDILTKWTNLLLHPTIGSATGLQVTDTLEDVLASDTPYVLVVEGAIPTGDMRHTCTMGGKPIADWIRDLSAKSMAAIGVGTCASLGGVATMSGLETNCQTLADFLIAENINTPVVNLPGCPVKPEHLVHVILSVAVKGALPALDQSGRPVHFFKHKVHERCVYYSDFQEKNYALKIGDDGCLLKLGCQGPITHNDCGMQGYNGNTNSCIESGHPCIGCASEKFPRKVMFRRSHDPRLKEIAIKELEV